MNLRTCEKIFKIVLIAGVAFVLSCGVQQPFANSDAAVREVTDDLGRKVIVPVKIERAVSLAPNLTENIFAVGAGDRLVGVTTYCNYPKEALAIEKVGDTQSPNAERIVALRPQVVFVSTASQLEAFMTTLAGQNIAVFVTNPTSFDGVLRNLTQLGDLFGTQAKAGPVVEDLKRRAENVKAEAALHPSVRVFVQFSKEPLYTTGRGSFLNEIVELAGGNVVTRDVPTAFPVLSKEAAMALQPEAIILSDSADNPEPNEAFKNSPAVRNGRVFRVNADILSRPGPRLVDALEEIAKDLK
ncbi:MAG TPA: cobalamin-binding protein [Pyrinomonadaceae bacterium]|nr:cobalamin-binding protein [Pyrinomonadaceae bacterium]